MNNQERQKLATLYSSWTDASLLSAIGIDREHYRPEVLPLLENEIQRRNLSLTMPVDDVNDPEGDHSTHTILRTVISACCNRFQWKHLTWIGKGYLIALSLLFVPLLGSILIASIAALIDEFSGSEMLTCIGMYLIMLLCGFPIVLGFISLIIHTMIVVFAWIYRKCFCR